MQWEVKDIAIVHTKGLTGPRYKYFENTQKVASLSLYQFQVVRLGRSLLGYFHFWNVLGETRF